MPFPPSPMSLPQQPHGGGGAPPDLSSVVDKFMKKNPDAVKQPANPFALEDIIRQAAKPKLPKMPLPPPGTVMDEEGYEYPEFEDLHMPTTREPKYSSENPPTPSSLPQMPLPWADPSEGSLYRGLLPPEERIWHDKPWT